MQVAGTDSPEPEQSFWMTSPQAMVCIDLILANRVIARLDLDRDDFPVVLGTHMREDVPFVDLLAPPTELLRFG